MIIYIIGPYTKGDTVINVRIAILAAEEILAKGHIPYIPHLTHFWHLLFPKPHQFWLDYDKNFIPFCDAAYRIPGESSGGDSEERDFIADGKPIYRSIDKIPDIGGN